MIYEILKYLLYLSTLNWTKSFDSKSIVKLFKIISLTILIQDYINELHL